MAFAQPLFILWGIVAGALPIVIHLLAQRRRQRIQFPTLRFLEAAAIEAHGHKRLREWLIVALRALALLMFFIALSRPIAMVGWMPTLLRDTAIIIVLDDSYSMSFRDGDESRFQRALNASRVLLRQWQYALIGLIYASTPERLRVALTNKHAGVQAVLRTSGVQWTEGYIQGAIQTAQRILNAHDAVDKHVVVFTDGQFLRNITHRDWREHSSTSKMNRPMDVILAPKVTIVDVRREFDDVNVGLRDWRIDAPITGLEPTLLRITLHNFGSKVWKGSISAKVDGKPLPDIVTLTIPPQADATVTFSLPISHQGWHRGVASWHDALPFDNRCYFAYYMPFPIRALCVDFEPGGRGSAYYVLQALNAVRSKMSTPLVIITNTQSPQWTQAQLARYDVIVLCHPKRLNGGAAKVLHDWVIAGGTIIMFLSEQVNARAFPSWMLSTSSVRLDYRASVRSNEKNNKAWRMRITASTHPALHGLSNADFSNVLVWRRFNNLSATDGLPLLSCDDGVPLLIEKRIGKGSLLVFSIRADARASTLPLTPAFVPLIYQLVNYGAMQAHRIERAMATVKRKPGVEIHQLHDGGSGSKCSIAKVVNVDGSDSDVRIPAPEKLQAIAKRIGWDYQTLGEWLHNPITAMRVDLRIPCLILAVLFLLAELTLAQLWRRR